jgi:hypothetical protein
MSVRIFRDVEEALARMVRRITFSESITQSLTVLSESFDPITGELCKVPIEPGFFDSSANARNIQYPDFFIKLVRTREDRFTSRGVPTYGREVTTPVRNSAFAFEIRFSGSGGIVDSVGDVFKTSHRQLRLAQTDDYLRILNGNNVGTYIIDSISFTALGPHEITLSKDLVRNLPEAAFNATTRELTFLEAVDLNTVAATGDLFEDASSTVFTISAVDADNGIITLGGLGTPDTSSGGKIERSGDVLKSVDPSTVRFIVMDPSKPIQILGKDGAEDSTNSLSRQNWAIPIDAYYLIRIDSKERANHIDILNKMWEEFNPPRTFLPIIIRNAASAEELLTADIASGGSTTVEIGDNSKFAIGETVFFCDKLTPTRDDCGQAEQVFSSVIVDKLDADKLVLQDTIPDTFKVENNSKVISNADYCKLFMHFVDHVTRDDEGAQYWSHDWTFWIQIWVDKNEAPKVYSVIQDICSTIENDEGIPLSTDC